MVGELVAGRYELEELVGTGGMSSVYRAHDRLLERKVALKILHDVLGRDADTIERFRREARAVAQLSHPHIVTVIDRGEDGGRQYIVFEYVDGENLKRVVEREGHLPVRRALTLAVTVGRALAFAHANGLVHRDVKPQNVLIDRDGRPKVTDFGIARSLDVDGMTRTGSVLGTSNYIAPEQASGRPVDALTDVYSLGCLLYELLTGEVPFVGENFVAVALKHVNEPAPRVIDRRYDVPLRTSNAVERAMAKDPRDRFASMDDFVAELEACVAALGADADADATHILPALPAPVPARREREAAHRPRRLGRLLAPLLALALIAAAAVAAFVLVDSGDGDGSSATTPTGQPARVTAIAAYDPEGTGGEHDQQVRRATDGDRDTYWPTETYRSFDKSGVGIVVDAQRETELSRLVVLTLDTPGFRAEIRTGGSATGPFETLVSPPRQVNGSTNFPIEAEAYRYYLVWITELPPEGVAHVAEITARA